MTMCFDNRCAWLLLLAVLAAPARAQLQDGDVGAETSPLTVAVDDATLPAEGNAGTSGVQVPVRLSRIPGVPVKVGYVVGDGSARGGAACSTGVDFIGQPQGILAYAVRENVKNIVVTVCGDAIHEGPQDLTVKLVAAEGATIADASGAVTIQDDDPLPSLSVTATSVAEGDAGTTGMTFTAKLAAASERALRLRLDLTTIVAAGDALAVSGSSCSGQVDYLTPPDAVDVAPGETTKVIDVKLCGDTVLEPDEIVRLVAGLTPTTQTSPSLVAGLSAAGTLLNDDPPALSVDDLAVAEGGSAAVSPVVVAVPVRATLRLSQRTTKTVSARVQTKDSSATGGSACPGTAPASNPAPDYVSLSSNATIRPGDLSATVALTICPDRDKEPDENFGLTLSDAVNARIEGGGATVRIRNDD
jgi:hypothetical protein